jgi:ubiquinone/menaquinone biosynthesis C-methylase UbiE
VANISNGICKRELFMNKVADVYNSDPKREWRRLEKDPYHTIEFLVTMHYIKKHLPANGKILDAGGGPGRYSIELCRMGYDVVLLDISDGCISSAKERFLSEPKFVQDGISEFVVGDISDLSYFEANSFDAILCLGGPLTHISEKEKRGKAMAELVRIAKPGAIIFISVMGYYAVLRTILMRFSHEIIEQSFQTLIESGDTIGSTGTLWHFFRADELKNLAESSGLSTIEMAGCEGLSSNLLDATNAIGTNGDKWDHWMRLLIKTSSDPSVVDMAEHILYIGQVKN